VAVASHCVTAGWQPWLDIFNTDGSQQARMRLADGFGFMPTVYALADGKSLMSLWWSYDGDGTGVYGRLFSTETLSFSSDVFQLNQDIAGNETSPQAWGERDDYVALPLANGGFAAFWVDSSHGEISGRFYGGASTGFAPAGNEFTVSLNDGGDSHWVSGDLMPNGNLLVAYSTTMPNGESRLQAKIFDQQGNVVQEPFLLDTTQTVANRARVEVLDADRVLVTWQELPGSGNSWDPATAHVEGRIVPLPNHAPTGSWQAPVEALTFGSPTTVVPNTANPWSFTSADFNDRCAGTGGRAQAGATR
jgi:hypothetical protein